jgi:hypothetical protein
MKPTVWPRRLSAWTTRAFWSGESLAKTVVRSAISSRAESEVPSMSLPLTTRSTWRPTSRQTLAATVALSPVRTFTATPFSWRRRMASAAESFGGSRKATKPQKTISASSATVTPRWRGGSGFMATATTRRPSLLRESRRF